jgi:class 3 adenylate cyclase
MTSEQPFQNGTASGSQVTTSPDAPRTFQDILAGEQVVVTVLCGTLDTAEVLTHGVGVDVMQRLRQTFFALAREEANRYDGTLKFFGTDGVLMLFGLPRAHGDHAQRAVRAALGLQHRLCERCTALDTSQPGDVTVRIGVHTGPMALNSLTDHAGFSSLAKAETTTLAIWLHYCATAGMVLISKATLPFVQDAVQCVEYGAVRIPGHADPVMAYRIGGRDR